MKRLSKLLIAIQAFLLLYPSMLGLLIVVGAVAPLASGSTTYEHIFDATIGFSVVLSLGCAWYVMAVFLFRGHAAARAIPSTVWYGLACVAACSVGSFLMRESHPELSVFAVGILFVPTFIHMSGEVWLRAE